MKRAKELELVVVDKKGRNKESRVLDSNGKSGLPGDCLPVRDAPMMNFNVKAKRGRSSLEDLLADKGFFYHSQVEHMDLCVCSSFNSSHVGSPNNCSHIIQIIEVTGVISIEG